MNPYDWDHRPEVNLQYIDEKFLGAGFMAAQNSNPSSLNPEPESSVTDQGLDDAEP